MNPPFLTFNIPRIVIAIGISLWMTSGCLLTCSKGDVRAAEVSRSVNAGHSCCHRPAAKKSHASRPDNRTDSLLASPMGSAKDCPLAANASAITAKNTGASSDAVAVTAVIPNAESRDEQTRVVFSSSQLGDRAPTYLRCCVFLI